MLDTNNYRSFRLDENSSSWTEITVDFSNPVGMNWGGESISHGKLIYFIGGSSGIIQEFNSETLTVSYITTIPDWSNSGTSSNTAFILDGQIYLFRNVGHFYKYNLTKETWTRVNNQPVPIGASAVYGQKMIVHKGKPWISGGSLRLVSDTANAGLSRSFGTYSGTFVPALYAYTDANSSSGSSGGSSTPQPGSVTTSMLSDTILKYLKPEITLQPSFAGQITSGESVSLSAQAKGKYLTYQWKKNGNNLDGETNATLTISDADPSQHDGNYTLVVTNDFGSVETTTIPLNILVQPSTHTVDLNSSVSLEMIWVEPGTFTMGSPASESGHDPSEEIQRNITITKGLYLGKHEVTQAQYEAVMAGNPYGLSSTPSQFVGPNKPVEMVSWNDFQFFLFRLNQQQSSNIPAGWAYVLPTEAEWEYACRAGTTTAYSWGSDINSSRANYNWDGGGSSGNDYIQTRYVGQYASNPWGFYDMHGNVFEMVSNWRGGNLLTDLVDPQGPESGVYRLQKGGSWYSDSHELRSANQNDNLPNRRSEALGFRLAFKRIH
jgi:formylglycine-generating enzyme required for sulfatase activity